MATLGLLLMAPPAFADVGGEDEGVGNSLAMPVIWAEDTIGPTLRGDDDEESDPQESALPDAQLGTYSVDPVTGVITYNPADTTYINEDGQNVFLQQVENNWWQAEHRKLSESGLDLTSEGKLDVSWVDWGDNLEVKNWSTKQKIRVETRLLQNVRDLPDADVAGPGLEGSGMTGYQMAKLKDAQKGPEEMWGVVATEEGSGQDATWVATENQVTEAFVYTGEACLTIERIDDADKEAWDTDSMTWTGTPVPGFPVCLGEGEGGLNQLAAEVTISGGMTYGSVWDPSGLPDGLYRMTFSLQKGSKVDITEGSTLYASAEESPDDGDDHSTEPLLVEEAGPGGSGGSGGAPEGNQAVLRPDLDLTYIDVGMGFVHGKPTRPVNLTATPDVESMTLAWDPPVYEGDSPITGYIVTAGVYGQYSVDAGTTTATITGLPGGAKMLFTVVAVNDLGPGDEASVVATPLAPPPPPTDPPTEPPTDPPTADGKAVTVRVRAVSEGKRLLVNVGPNKGSGYYQFTVQKLAGGTWRTLPSVYTTYGKGEIRRLRLARGTYRVIVLPRYGLRGATSKAIALRSALPAALPIETDEAVRVKARSRSEQRKLFVNVNPNMGTGYFQFVVQKRSSGDWRALSTVYKTRTRVEKRTLNLRRGTYRVMVMPRYGYQGAMSDSIWLRR